MRSEWAYGAERTAVLRRYDTLGDPSPVASELRAGRRAARTAIRLGILDVYARLHEIPEASGSGSIVRASSCWRRCCARSTRLTLPPGSYPAREDAPGIGDLTILEALSLAYGGDRLRPALEAAYTAPATLSIGAALREQGLEAVAQLTIRPGNPVRPALVERLADAVAISARKVRAAEPGSSTASGCRSTAAMTRGGSSLRNLEELSAMLPEVTEATR